MKHVTYADKGLFLGDDIADLVMRYATELAQQGLSENATVHALDADGNASDATFLLGPGMLLLVETVDSDLPEPENTDAVRYLSDRLDELTRPHNVSVADADRIDLPPDY